MYFHIACLQKGFVVVDKDTHSAPKKLERKAWGWGADKKDGDTLLEVGYTFIPELPGGQIKEGSTICDVILQSRQTSSGGAGWSWCSGSEGDFPPGVSSRGHQAGHLPITGETVTHVP